jgi:hypothetical protein
VGDRARRQTRLAITQPNDRPITSLIGQELEHIRRRSIPRIPRHHGEGRLQIEGHRAQRVRPRSAGHELQVPVDELITEPTPHLARPISRAHQERETSHHRTLTAARPPARYDTNITRVLGDLSRSGRWALVTLGAVVAEAGRE